MEKSLSRVSAESMKAAYDQVGTKPIAAREIQGWITRYGEAPRKVRIARIAANVSQQLAQLVDDVGVESQLETCNDVVAREGLIHESGGHGGVAEVCIRRCPRNEDDYGEGHQGMHFPVW